MTSQQERDGKPTATASRLRMPKFDDDDAKQFWKETVAAYKHFKQEDTPVLIMLCDAWSQYRRAYKALGRHSGDAKLESVEATLVCKWFDRLYKMLIALGMTPCQREKMGIPPTYEPLASVERRGMPGMGEEEEYEERDA